MHLTPWEWTVGENLSIFILPLVGGRSVVISVFVCLHLCISKTMC